MRVCVCAAILGGLKPHINRRGEQTAIHETASDRLSEKMDFDAERKRTAKSVG